MSGAIIGVNLAVRLLLELCALCALAYWGAKSGDGRIATTGLGIGASLADAVLWATGLKDESKWVAIPEAKAPDGAFVHQRGVSSVRGLYSLHRPEWQWTPGSALLYGVGDDASYLCGPDRHAPGPRAGSANQ